MNKNFNSKTTKMVGRTYNGDPVWKPEEGRLFKLTDTGVMKPIRWAFPWPRKWGYRRLKAPYLNYEQVAVVSDKSRTLLKALLKGPLKEKNGFIHSRDNKVIMARATARVVLHWMQGCGVVLKRTPTDGGFTRIDMDVEATKKNGVV